MLPVNMYISNKSEQFYKIIRPISLLLKFLEFFPFQNPSSNNGLDLSYDKFNGYIHLTATVLIYTVPSIYIIDNGENYYILLSVATLALIITVWILACFRTDEILLEIIHCFEKHDELYIKSKLTANCNRFKYRGFVLFILILIWIIFNINTIEYLKDYKNIVFNKTIMVVWMHFIQNAAWLAMFGGFYVALSWELSIRFQELQQSISTDLTVAKIEELRLMHGQLKDINDKINSCFGFRLSLFYLHFLHGFLYQVYTVVVATHTITVAVLLAQLKIFTVLYLVCYSSELAVIQKVKNVHQCYQLFNDINTVLFQSNLERFQLTVAYLNDSKVSFQVSFQYQNPLKLAKGLTENWKEISPIQPEPSSFSEVAKEKMINISYGYILIRKLAKGLAENWKELTPIQLGPSSFRGDYKRSDE
ncbi:hypothetical protein J6590_018104 [Homalodisca vitripennis]|nr:hypothetical protein J6590_018104 [Homalodisca vitripennis]